MRKLIASSKTFLTNVLLLLAVFLLGQQAVKTKGTFTEIEAERIYLRDHKGVRRMSIDGTPRISLKHDNGRPGISLFIFEDGKATLLVQEKTNVLGSSISLSVNESTRILLFDNKAKARIHLTTLDGSPSISLNDNKGEQRMSLGMHEDAPNILLFDNKQKIRAVLGVTELLVPKTGEEIIRPESSLVLLGPDGKVIFQAPR